VDHPYGHGKAEPIAALCIGLSLVAVAVTIMVESIHEILTSHRLPAPYTLVVLAGVLIAKGLLFRHLGGIGESIGSLAVKSDAHHRSDAITSAFAFVGIYSSRRNSLLPVTVLPNLTSLWSPSRLDGTFLMGTLSKSGDRRPPAKAAYTGQKSGSGRNVRW
jgi:hypothetical protein